MRISITEAPNAVTTTALPVARTVYDVASAGRGGRPLSGGRRIMTLLIALPAAVILGWFFGRRTWVGVVAGLVWYLCLAIQTAYLAHPGRTGFFGIDALAAIQGSGFGQYWVAQAVIAGVLAAGLLGADRVHQSWSGRSRPRAGTAHLQPGPRR